MVTRDTFSEPGPVFGLLLFSLALWVLHQELQMDHFEAILQQFYQIPLQGLWAALLLTMMTCSIMTGYAFSSHIGLSMIAGAWVRHRLHPVWGLSGLENECWETG